MRRISYKERDKHGCLSCSDRIGFGKKGSKCPHERCPYHDLDDYDSYAEYLEATKGDTPVEFFLSD